MLNVVVVDQLILFHKPNKKVMSEKKIYHFITQTKHTLNLADTTDVLHPSNGRL
jgi:hypothetical protein